MININEIEMDEKIKFILNLMMNRIYSLEDEIYSLRKEIKEFKSKGE